MGTDGVIDPCSGSYAWGETIATLAGAAFAGAHLGRNDINQMKGGVGRALGRVFYDNRQFPSVRRVWSEAEGNGVPYLLNAGQSLHHWFIPQRAIVPYAFSQGTANAGWNYFPLNAKWNSYMNGQGFSANLFERLIRGAVIGLYGATVRDAKQKC